jgi:ABC-type multidrug transport system fused ATPase/permease subunit
MWYLVKEAKSIEELEHLAKGSDKDKKIAATYGYQPILDKLMKDESEDVAKLAKIVDKDEELKLYKNDQENDEAKSNFERSYKKYLQLFYATIIAVVIAVIMEVVAAFMLIGSYSPSIWFWIIGGIIFLVISLIIGYLSRNVEKQYKASRQRVQQTQFLFEASERKFNHLQNDIEKGYR